MVEIADTAGALAAGVDAALPAWVERCVDRVHRAWAGPPPPDVVDAAARAGEQARAAVSPKVRALLDADIDDQATTPLALVREAVAFPTAVLRAAGVPPRERDGQDEAIFPDDCYGLTPANFGDLDPGLTDVALAWGASKAFVHLRRRGAR